MKIHTSPDLEPAVEFLNEKEYINALTLSERLSHGKLKHLLVRFLRRADRICQVHTPPTELAIWRISRRSTYSKVQLVDGSKKADGYGLITRVTRRNGLTSSPRRRVRDISRSMAPSSAGFLTCSTVAASWSQVP
jgi:hypothetical protein